MASFHSAFLADDTLVTIVPDFDMENPVQLMSAAAAGPFKAGIPSTVPLWLAMMLQQRSLCTLKVPDWLSIEHLTLVKQYELQNDLLTPSEDERATEDVYTTQDGSPVLPFYYAELGQRFTSARTTAGGGTGESAQASKASNLVLADITQIRLDKLRQQFQGIWENIDMIMDPNLTLTVPGIASCELAQLKSMLQQALQDQRFLVTAGGTKDEEGASKAGTGTGIGIGSTRRRSQKTMIEGQNDEIDNDKNDDDENMLSSTQDSRFDEVNTLRSRMRRLPRG